MTKRKRTSHPARAGLFAAVAAFVLLSVFAGGLVEVSHEVGAARWFIDSAVYMLANKFTEKLIASAVIGMGACFVGSMIAYGKSVKTKKRGRATSVRFTPEKPGVGRTA